ncbi:helix-turn-helix transcriptional regulator [Planctomicrobium sp. SH668]|uniref:helix-turn-helix transcriptional regulator n=1 Tax=Planctomicrobium sp. SH668 TaxID=3448126 RepID=UPI003F5C1910
MTPSELISGTIPPPLLTVDDLAAVLKVSKRTIWRMRSCCQLPKPVKVGGGVRWRKSDIDAWIAQGCPTLPVRKQD